MRELFDTRRAYYREQAIAARELARQTKSAAIRRRLLNIAAQYARMADAAAVLGVFAEFETNLRRGRQLEGISATKARGVYKGRKPSIDASEVRRLRKDEKLGPAAIARRLGIGRASVYRLLGKQGAVAANGGGDADQT